MKDDCSVASSVDASAVPTADAMDACLAASRVDSMAAHLAASWGSPTAASRAAALDETMASRWVVYWGERMADKWASCWAVRSAGDSELLAVAMTAAAWAAWMAGRLADWAFALVVSSAVE